MASRKVCDGCGAVESEKWEEIGVVDKKDYCEACAVVAVEYIAERDALHTSLAAKWGDGVGELNDRYGNKLNELPS